MPNQSPRFPLKLLYRMYRHVFPIVYRELNYWRKQAEQITDAELRKQAIASMTSKQFHCEGGSVYAVAGIKDRQLLVPLIVAFQTISDYLDNLCDRSTSQDPNDFRQLHQAMLDAVNPNQTPGNYYRFRREKDDNGYLQQLVATCQRNISAIPNYHLVQEPIQRLVSLYCDLQVYKHLHPDVREQKLLKWWDKHKEDYKYLRWYEFAAATGSTLGVFMLFKVACEHDATLERVQEVLDAYFPWVCGLHILLDYLIDQDEDVIGGDLNFCTFYKDVNDTIERLDFFRQEARRQVAVLPDASFHAMIVEGLLGLYLSDQKVRQQPFVAEVSQAILKRSRWTTVLFYLNSRFYRFMTAR